MQDLFARNGFTPEERISALTGAPGRIFFLTPEFIAAYWPLTAMPPERRAGVTACARRLQDDPEARALVWHLYSEFCIRNRAGFPEILAGLEAESGKIYILLLMALIPFFEERAIREKFPVKYARAAADRIGSSTVFFAQKYHGEFGILAKSLPFMLNFKNRPCFRIGRFDFEMMAFDEFLPEIYSAGGQTAALCQDGWQFDDRGERTQDPARAVHTTRLVRTADTVTGTPVNPESGYAESDEVTLDLKHWTRLAGPGDWTIHYHIPGGGGMTPEVCEAAFTEAKTFFAEYFPDKPAKIIWTNSWFFNPAYKEYLPESNIAKLSRTGSLFPVFSTGKDGLYFVFGREDDDFATYECRTSLQKAVLRCRRERGFLRRTGWFIPIK
ncbi:MAG: hypothetical protein MR051_06635 [Lentisphaeria bacterium]|nr:hypothetical protein [Lentisphaeria bacterium]